MCDSASLSNPADEDIQQAPSGLYWGIQYICPTLTFCQHAQAPLLFHQLIPGWFIHAVYHLSSLSRHYTHLNILSRQLKNGRVESMYLFLILWWFLHWSHVLFFFGSLELIQNDLISCFKRYILRKINVILLPWKRWLSMTLIYSTVKQTHTRKVIIMGRATVMATHLIR